MEKNIVFEKEELETNMFKGYTVKIFSTEDIPEAEREEIVSLEMRAYESAGYGSRAEGNILFGYPKQVEFERANPITHILIYADGPKGNVIYGYLSYFKIDRFIFSSCEEKARLDGVDSNIPKYVFRKIIALPKRERDEYLPIKKSRFSLNPLKSTLLNILSPLQLVMLNMVNSLVERCDGEFLLETLAQPDTQKILNSKLKKFFGNRVNILVDEELKDDKDGIAGKNPHIILLHFTGAKKL